MKIQDNKIYEIIVQTTLQIKKNKQPNFTCQEIKKKNKLSPNQWKEGNVKIRAKNQATQVPQPATLGSSPTTSRLALPQDHLRALQPAAPGPGHTNQWLGSRHRGQGWPPTRPGVACLPVHPQVLTLRVKKGPTAHGALMTRGGRCWVLKDIS